MRELTARCGAKYGRQTQLAHKLGVSKQLVTNSGRALTLEHYFANREFLEDQKRRKK